MARYKTAHNNIKDYSDIWSHLLWGRCTRAPHSTLWAPGSKTRFDRLRAMVLVRRSWRTSRRTSFRRPAASGGDTWRTSSSPSAPWVATPCQRAPSRRASWRTRWAHSQGWAARTSPTRVKLVLELGLGEFKIWERRQTFCWTTVAVRLNLRS